MFFLPTTESLFTKRLVAGMEQKLPRSRHLIAPAIQAYMVQGETAAVLPLPIIQSVLCQTFTCICLAHTSKTTPSYGTFPDT